MHRCVQNITAERKNSNHGFRHRKQRPSRNPDNDPMNCRNMRAHTKYSHFSLCSFKSSAQKEEARENFFPCRIYLRLGNPKTFSVVSLPRIPFPLTPLPFYFACELLSFIIAPNQLGRVSLFLCLTMRRLLYFS